MVPIPLCEAVAEAVAAEAVELAFGLMGNGNMYVMDAIGRRTRLIHARHEHGAVTMADGFARYTGRPGVALITNGPGFTQVMTALTIAARSRSPLVVIAGDACQRLPFHIHTIDQAPLATATGAVYVPIRAVERLDHDLAYAFATARNRRLPVVVGIPEDMQRVPVETRYRPSDRLAVAAQRPRPDPVALAAALEPLLRAERPVILAGRGAVQAGPALVELADASGALLATSLLAKGLFDGHPFDVGVAGGLSTPLGRELLSQSDTVLAFGARLGHYTTNGGQLFADAKIVQVTCEPEAVHEGVRTADLHLVADVAVATDAMLAGLREHGIGMAGWRSDALRDRIASEVADPAPFTVPAGRLDPREVMTKIDAVVPKDWDIVCGLGHFFFFAMTGLGGRRPERYHVISEFGAIGSALAAAIGIAAARRDGRVLLIDGDGSMMMHLGEIETAGRHGVALLITVFNDGAYGAELHKLRAQGLDVAPSLHGDVDLAAVARAFGLEGARIQDLQGLDELLARYVRSQAPMLWDIKIADTVPAPQYRF